VLPEPQRDQWLTRDDLPNTVEHTWALRKGAGPKLAAWWRSQDPVPATVRNEAVEEHLRRVEFAERKYPDDRRLRGFDDRGAVFIRLGPPPSVRDVTLDLDRYKLEILRQYRLLAQSGGGPSGGSGNSGSGGGRRGQLDYRRGQPSGASGRAESRTPILNVETQFPEHTIWVYPEYGESAHFTFVKRAGSYQLVRPDELLPRSLRPPYSGSDRGVEEHALLVLESIYRTYVFDPAYAALYDELNHYLTEPPPENWNIQAAQRPNPETFAQTRVLNGTSTAQQQARIRARSTPARRSTVNEELARVPLALRMARFLDEGGATRALLYWTHPPGALDAEASLMNATVVQFAPNFQPQVERSKRYVPTPSGTGLEVRSLPISGRADRFHLRLQVDQYAIKGRADDGSIRRGAQIGRTVATLDSVEALSNDPSQLVLSDLLSGTLVSSNGTEAAGTMGLKPYPLDQLDPGQPLTLYFEVYHLTLASSDQTRYTVEYEVERKTEGGAFRLFRDRTERTTTVTTYEGTGRRAQEYIQLGLSDLESADEVRITVRVTDEVSGQRAERSITFDAVE
jgi:GWxTD domain-containing protein